MLPEIAWSQQLVLYENSIWNWRPLRENIDSKWDQLFTISFGEISDRTN
jgi:hypothetical protein